MAEIGRTISNSIHNVLVDADPRISGVDAPLGSYAKLESNGTLYVKTDANNTDWELINPFNKAISENVVTSNEIDFAYQTNLLSTGSNSSLSYLNDTPGQATTIFINNTSGSTITISFPGTHNWPDGTISNEVLAGELWAFSVIPLSNGEYAVTTLKGLA